MSRTLLLDTTVFSSLLRKAPEVQERFVAELQAGATVFVSPVVYYELRRGLLKRDAHRLLAFLDALIGTLVWTELTRGDWEEAADLWVATHRAGRPRADADLLIAAQAKRRGAVRPAREGERSRGRWRGRRGGARGGPRPAPRPCAWGTLGALGHGTARLDWTLGP